MATIMMHGDLKMVFFEEKANHLHRANDPGDDDDDDLFDDDFDIDDDIDPLDDFDDDFDDDDY